MSFDDREATIKFYLANNYWTDELNYYWTQQGIDYLKNDLETAEEDLPDFNSEATQEQITILADYLFGGDISKTLNVFIENKYLSYTKYVIEEEEPYPTIPVSIEIPNSIPEIKVYFWTQTGIDLIESNPLINFSVPNNSQLTNEQKVFNKLIVQYIII